MTGIPKQGPVIAIDGPAGTGKSTTTKKLAEALGFVHVDTGALYRALAFLLIERFGKDFKEDVAIELSRSIHLEFKRDPAATPANRILADGRDVTTEIRTPEVSMGASRVSAIPGVRSALLGLQRRLGCAGSSVLEGRDIGTVVFPDADVKFFLTASVEERTKRRLLELKQAGKPCPDFDELRQQIETRDQGDSTRAVAPLKKADDAIEVDTTKMTLDEVVKFMESEARKRLGAKLKAGVTRG
jgi:cytidylate kinase